MKLIDGKALAKKMREELKEKIASGLPSLSSAKIPLRKFTCGTRFARVKKSESVPIFTN